MLYSDTDQNESTGTSLRRSRYFSTGRLSSTLILRGFVFGEAAPPAGSAEQVHDRVNFVGGAAEQVLQLVHCRHVFGIRGVDEDAHDDPRVVGADELPGEQVIARVAQDRLVDCAEYVDRSIILNMTSKGNLTRARLTASMLELIQTSGYSGTGLNAVIEHAAAPKGSIYFHFPDGKEGLGVAAVELAATQFEALIVEAVASTGSAAGAARAAIEALAAIVGESDYRLGCPVSVVALEMGAESERLRQACASAFESWIAPTASLLESSGLAADEARALATAVVSMIEGAVIISRATRSTQPLVSAADVVAELIEQRVEKAEGTR